MMINNKNNNIIIKKNNNHNYNDTDANSDNYDEIIILTTLIFRISTPAPTTITIITVIGITKQQQ